MFLQVRSMLKIISGPKLNPKPKLVPVRVMVQIGPLPVLVMSKLKIMPPPLEPNFLSMPCWLTAVLPTVSTTIVPAVTVVMTMQTMLQ